MARKQIERNDGLAIAGRIAGTVGGMAGFTLIEVVIALGVFAFATTLILGYFLKGNSRLRALEDRVNAVELISAVNAKLQELGWDAVMNHGQPGIVELTQSSPLLLVADVGVSRMRLESDADGLKPAEQFYLLTVDRSHEFGLRYKEDLHGVLIVKIRVSWPYRLPASGGNGYVETQESDRSFFEFISSVRP